MSFTMLALELWIETLKVDFEIWVIGQMNSVA